MGIKAYLSLFWLGLGMVGLVSSITAKPMRSQTLPQPQTPPPREYLGEINPTLPNTFQEPPNIPGTYTVRGFKFEGSTVFSNEELLQATGLTLPREISFAELLEAASKVTKLYFDKGYITSGAYIPAQQIESNKTGIFTIQVVEGELGDINIYAEGLDRDYVESRLAIATKKPLNQNRLQEALELLRLDPLIENINAELSAGTKPGLSVLTVDVTVANSSSIQLNLDNNRNPSVGSFQRRLQVFEGNLFRLGHQASFAYSNTDGSNEFEINYSLPINPHNGTLSANYNYTNSNIIEQPFDILDIETTARDFNLTLRQPIVQKATGDVYEEFALGLTASRRESDSSILDIPFPISLGADAEGRTRVSAVRFSQEYTQRNRTEVLAGRSQFSLGLGAFDATINEDNPDSQFFAWRGQFLWLRLLNSANPSFSSTLLVRSDIQFAFDSLVPLEQFGLGGQSSVRGYRQDALLGDNGVFASAEVRVPILRVSEIDGILQVSPFIDFGTTWNTNTEALNPNTLVGLGVGLRWQMLDNFTARFDWGIPLVDINSGDGTWQEDGVYFSIEYKHKF
ncbi:MAG TPA: hemolysin activation/secretion protein [Cyanobacteria bacterium UBA9273]|nr:hemolysin activation/secretion protein [Cyanobacteria bacterium UBA9273]